MKQIAPCVYLDDKGNIRIQAEEVILMTGLPVTEEYLRVVTQALIEEVKRRWPDMKVRVVTEEGRPDQWTTPEVWRENIIRSN